MTITYEFMPVAPTDFFHTVMQYSDSTLTMWNERHYISLTNYSTIVVISDMDRKNEVSFYFPADAFAVHEYEGMLHKIKSACDRLSKHPALFTLFCKTLTRMYGLDRAFHTDMGTMINKRLYTA